MLLIGGIIENMRFLTATGSNLHRVFLYAPLLTSGVVSAVFAGPNSPCSFIAPIINVDYGIYEQSVTVLDGF